MPHEVPMEAKAGTKDRRMPAGATLSLCAVRRCTQRLATFNSSREGVALLYYVSYGEGTNEMIVLTNLSREKTTRGRVSPGGRGGISHRLLGEQAEQHTVPGPRSAGRPKQWSMVRSPYSDLPRE